jgi:hypothetical protein
MHTNHEIETVVALSVIMVLVAVVVVVGWVLPITLGVHAARRKNYSPHWMWFGIHPIFGWVACIVLLCLTPRIQCTNCGGFVTVNFRICPYCHAGLDLQPNRTCRPVQPPSS